jgi:hypothetical protein
VGSRRAGGLWVDRSLAVVLGIVFRPKAIPEPTATQMLIAVVDTQTNPLPHRSTDIHQHPCLQPTPTLPPTDTPARRTPAAYNAASLYPNLKARIPLPSAHRYPGSRSCRDHH